MRAGVKPSTLRFYKERMLRVLIHIQQHLDESLSLEKLAALGGLAPHHFHHVFTGMIGETLAAHVRRLRLERAASRLKLGALPVIQIAFEAGYESHEAFCRAFRQGFQSSPTQFRRQHRRQLELLARCGVHYRAKTELRNFRAFRNGKPNMKATIKQLAPMRVAFMRHVGPYNEVGKTWEKLMLFLGKEGLIGGDALFLGICHDDPQVTPSHKIRYDACMTIGEDFKPQEDIGVQIVLGGDYAVMTHFGPYEKLNRSYARLLGQWLPRSGRTLRSAPCFEVYLNSPENTDPPDLLTDLHAPLEPITSL